MQYILVALFCLLATGVHSRPEESAYLKDDDLPKCPANVEEAGDCVKTILNVLIPRLRKGDPKLGIPPYDPVVIDRLTFQYTSGAVSGRISVRNLKIYGFAEHTVVKVNTKMNGDKMKIRIISRLPKMNLLGNYKAEMQVNSIQLKPKGTFNVSLFDVENRVMTEGEIYTKNGLRFLRLLDIDVSPKIGDMVIKANGIFPDPELDELALNVANTYWKDIYGIILPETRDSWAPVMLRLINESLQHVPIDQFIDNPE